MKKYLLFAFAILLFGSQLKAQTPQFVLVHNGTSSVFTTWDATYAQAVDGDNIYFPGGSFNITNPINVRLNIYGAGYNIDSSQATGVTKLNSIYITSGGQGGKIEGIYFIPSGYCSNEASINFGHTSNLNPLSIFTVSNCYLPYGILCSVSCTNMVIKNNFIGGYNCNNGGPRYSLGELLSNSLISNNIFTGALNISGSPNLQVNNNIFFYQQDFYYMFLSGNSIYNNNINLGSTTVSNSIFNNNTNLNPSGSNNIITNPINESFNDIFINPGVGPYYSYDVHNDYHIKNTSLCKNSGTDGTDRGIYGGLFPWKDGSSPSNPHIYYKQISSQSGSDGKLNVRVKVRTNN